MSTSQRTLEQVKSILGMLDRRIDALRARRLGGPQPPAAPLAATPNIGVSETRATKEPTNGFGRAQPLRLADRADH